MGLELYVQIGVLGVGEGWWVRMPLQKVLGYVAAIKLQTDLLCSQVVRTVTYICGTAGMHSLMPHYLVPHY